MSLAQEIAARNPLSGGRFFSCILVRKLLGEGQISIQASLKSCQCNYPRKEAAGDFHDILQVHTVKTKIKK
jgi:hypothetical protein